MTKITKRFFAWLAVAAALVGGTLACTHATLLDKHGQAMHPVNALTANCTDKRGDIVLGCIAKQARTIFGAVVDNFGGITISHTTGDMDLNGHVVHSAGAAVSSTDLARLGQIAATRLDQFATPTASVGFGNQKATSLADGTASSDGAAFHQIGDAVRAIGALDVATVTTAALPAYTAAGTGVGKTITFNSNAACGTIGGYAVALNDSVLVQNGASFADNGLYAATALGDGATTPCVLTRDTRADTAAEIATTQVHIVNGTRRGAVYSYGGTISPTVDTSAISYLRRDVTRGPNEWIEWSEDFASMNSPGTGTIIPGPGGLITTMAAGLIAAGTSTSTATGMVNMACNSSGNSALATFGSGFFLDTPSYWLIEMRHMIRTAISNGTNTFRWQMGLASATSGVAATDGLFVEHDIAQDTTHWLLNVRKSSTTTSLVASAIATDTLIRDSFVHYAGETVVHLLENGVDLGTTSTTNVPLNTGLNVLLSCVRSAGTGGLTAADFIRVALGFPNGRG